MFDRYVVVDWSASSTPKRGRDSIWIAVRDAAGCALVNPSTRREAERFLVDLVERYSHSRTLVGFDFSLGYPSGTAAALGLDGPAWMATASHLADLVVDDERNANNRFEVAASMNEQMTAMPSPFWGCPPSAAGPTLTSTRHPEGPVGRWRLVEQVLRGRGRRPFSSWQLFGAGAVGSQSLLGIPMVERLRCRFGDRIEVWPFTTGLNVPRLGDGGVVIAEVWPSMLRVEAVPDEVRDQAQVRVCADWLADLDLRGQLASHLEIPLTDAQTRLVENEEGWTLGVTMVSDTIVTALR